MASVLFRGGTPLCGRCLHRELCRVVWRSQTALFSSKSSDRKQPRRTHIKKAKPQPAVDISELLEKLFSQRRPGAAPPAAARPAKASLTKPATSSSSSSSWVNGSTSNIPPLPKTTPAAASSFTAFNAAPQPKSTSQSNPETPISSESSHPQPSPNDAEACAADGLSSATSAPPSLGSTEVAAEETAADPVHLTAIADLPLSNAETNVGTSTSAAVTADPLTITVESSLPPVFQGLVDAAADKIPTKDTHSGLVDVLHAAKEGETTLPPPLEVSLSAEALETRASVVEGPVEPTIEAALDVAAQEFTAKSTDSGLVEASHTAAAKPLVETMMKVAEESTPLPLKPKADSTIESSSGNVAVEEVMRMSEQTTPESVTLDLAKVLAETSTTEELPRMNSLLDEKAVLVQMGIGAEAESSPKDEREILTTVISNWKDLKGSDSESGSLMNELLGYVPAGLSETPATLNTSSASHPPAAAAAAESPSKAEAMTLESVTLAEVKAEVGSLESETLQETCDLLDKEAEKLAQEEELQVKTTSEDAAAIFEDPTEAEVMMLHHISEATDAIEAETSVMLEAMFGSEQGSKQLSDAPLTEREPRDETRSQEAEKEASVVEAMSLESVTLAEVEASLGILERESLSEMTDYLEKEAEILAGEEKMEVEGGREAKETTEAVSSDPLAEAETVSEDLQTDALMEELFFTVPHHTAGGTGGQGNILDAAAETDDGPALKEVLQGQEVVEEAATESEGDTEMHTALDPVQKLFLDKIREYKDIRRLNGGPLEAEPDYKKHLSEETVKLQRLHGGGDLSSFPQFTFTEPEMDQDSK